MILKNKKSQVTVFILIGMVILIIMGGSYYLMTESSSVDTSVVMGEMSEASTEAKPVQNYVLSCLEDTSKSAIKIISKNGGYINPMLNAKTRVDTKKSELIFYGPYKLPYWFYLDDDDNRFSSKMPVLTKEQGDGSIEEQLENYVENNLGICISNFARFRERFLIEYKAPEVIVDITDEGIVFQMNMPTNIISRTDDRSTKLEKYYIDIPTQFKKLYYMSRDITETQSMTSFLERPILEIISLRSGLEKPLPPKYFVDMFAFGASETWFKDDVHRFLRTMVLPKTSMIQITDSANFFPDFSAQSVATSYNLRDVSIQRILNPSYEYYDIDAFFSFPSTVNPYIKVGSGSAVLRADKGDAKDMAGIFSMMLSPIIHKYRFNYDLTYPVVTKVCDKDSFNGEGLCFNFALEANIRMNEAYSPLNSGPEFQMFGVSSGQRAEVDIGNQDQFVNKKIKFDIVDAVDRKPIDDVKIYYVCGREFDIDKVNIENEKSTFSGRLPFCAMGGKIVLRKQGYKTEVRPFNNIEDNSEVSLERFEMYKIKELNASVKKRGVTSLINNQELVDGERVFIEITKFKEFEHEEDFPLLPFLIFGDTSKSSDASFGKTMEQYVNQAPNEDISQDTIDSLAEISEIDNTQTTQSRFINNTNISLVPGLYKIKMTYIISGNPAIHIPAETKRICLNGEKDDGGFCAVEMKKIDLPEINMPSWVVSSSEVMWEVEADDLYESDNLMFMVPFKPIPKNYDSFEDYVEEVEIPNMNKFKPVMR